MANVLVVLVNQSVSANILIQSQLHSQKRRSCSKSAAGLLYLTVYSKPISAGCVRIAYSDLKTSLLHKLSMSLMQVDSQDVLFTSLMEHEV